MQISVVIPTHNRAHTLERALRSVLTQTSEANEILVIDDGSVDNTRELITRQFPQVRLLSQQQRGVSAARNLGIKEAQFDWIALLDSDDEWLANKLETIRQHYHRNRDILLFHSDEIWIRDGVRVNPMKKHQKSGGMIFSHCLPLCVISPSAAVIHRQLFEDVGLFNENLPACEDYDLWLRVCQRFPVHYIDQPLIRKYGGHEDQLSRRFIGMDRFRIRALHDLMQSNTLTPEQAQQTRQMLLNKLRILIKGAYKHRNHELLLEFEPLLAHYEAMAC